MTENGSGARRVLIVEDDVMIRMLIEDMLGDLGFAVAAEASKVHEALAAVNSTAFDVAILDVNLSGETTGPVAEALAARGTPFVFATGYGEHGLPDQFRDRPLLKKPFQIESLKRMLETALAGAKAV
jgi:CheY-like chemotaxis protein